MSDRICPETDCRRRIRRDRFACAVHWRVLRPETQRAINAAYRRWLVDPNAQTAKELEAAQAIGIRELS